MVTPSAHPYRDELAEIFGGLLEPIEKVTEKVCPVCNAKLPPTTTICDKCGETLAPQLPFSCPKCNKRYERAYRYCPDCKIPLTETNPNS